MGATPAVLREVAAQFAAVLMRETLAPLSKALGFYGDAALAASFENLARSERGGLVDVLVEALARATNVP